MLSTPISKNWLIATLIGSSLFVYLFAQELNFRENMIIGALPLLSIYPCGIAGTIGVLTLSRLIGYLPGVSYLGRYSIMILVSHVPVMMASLSLLKRTSIPYELTWLAVGLIILVASFIIIPFMKRFLPHVTAQKDVFKLSKK